MSVLRKTFDLRERQVEIKQVAAGVYRNTGTHSYVALEHAELVRSVEVTNYGVSDVYLFLFDAAAVPDDSTAWLANDPLVTVCKVPANSASPYGRALFRPVTKGLVIAASASPTTFTKAGTIQVVVEYGR